MKKLNLASQLRDNPGAAKHADSIKETISALRKLRASGFGGDGYTLIEPFGAKGSIKNAPRAHNRQPHKNPSKMTEDA